MRRQTVPAFLAGHQKRRAMAVAAGLAAAVGLLLIMLLSLLRGAMPIAPGDVARALLGQIPGCGALAEGLPANVRAVVGQIRLPRVLCSALAGAGLAAAGVMFQAVLQNPLADPYTMGVSSGAAFGASLALLLNMQYGMALGTTPVALACALLTLAAVLAIAQRGGGGSVANLVISGIIVGSVLSSGISFIKMLAGEQVGAIVFWLMGSFSAVTLADARLLALVLLPCLALALWFSGDLNLLSLGDDAARGLGLEPARGRMLFLLLGAGITAACVSVCGIIGFVGLVVPHLLRLLLCNDHRALLPLSALFGAVLLCAADDLTRVLANGEIPVGVLTTLLGGPFFIYLFLRRGGGMRP